MTKETKQHQLDWRRSQVPELNSMGYTQREISRILQIDLSAVTRDIRFLRQQAQDNIQKHIQHTMPEEYQKANVRLDHVIKKAWHIFNSTADERVRLAALALMDQCTTHKMELVSGGTVFSNALKYTMLS